MTRRRTGRKLLVGLAALAAALAAAGWWARDPAERAIRERIQEEARRRGLTARVEGVRVGVVPFVALTGLRVEKPGTWALTAESAGLTLGGRLSFGRATLAGPAGLTLDAVPTVWDIVDQHTVELWEPARGLTVRWAPADGGRRRVDVFARAVPAGALFTIAHGGVPLLDAGVVAGALHFAGAEEGATFEVDVQGTDVRLAAIADDAEDGGGASFGQPTAVQSRFSGAWRPREHTLELPRWRVATRGATLAGSLTVADLPADPRIDLALEVERVDFARLLEMSALPPPNAVAGEGGTAGGLGSASLTARISGRLADARSFSVSQRLDFTPPPRPLPALERLRGAFVHEVTTPDGVKQIAVSPGSPDFIALAEVPPLFVETLLLGEDAGFFGHHGVDLAEVPAAVVTNWSRGGAARGASTITQQLAKNLFLSRDKKLGRKLQELSLALLLEATLDKQRILEIYLNVIEWGPGLHGLRPAARRYFQKEPRELTPREMAFLVALIPGPLKYQRSFASGTLSPGFRPLVDNLLVKLRSVEALGEREYEEALAEDLRIAAPMTSTVSPSSD